MPKAQEIVFPFVGRAEIREIEIPDPAPDEVQVRCVANGICMLETSVFTGTEPLNVLPIPGHEGVGVVVKAGSESDLQEGDWVSCNSWRTLQNCKANRERQALKLSGPPRDAATFLVEPAACVVTALRAYEVAPGDRVLVLGAGFMGLLNVQALAHSPVGELVVADVKARNLKLAREFGATHCIDGSTPEGQAELEAHGETPFDLVVECAGAAQALEVAGRVTRPGGRLAIFAWHHQKRLVDLGLWHSRGLKVLNAAPGIGRDFAPQSFERAIRLLERGVFDMTKLVTHRHNFADVQQAMDLSAHRDAHYIKGVLEFG